MSTWQYILHVINLSLLIMLIMNCHALGLSLGMFDPQ